MVPKVPTKMNEKMCLPFTSDEVEVALKMIGPLKSLGPDGYGACFFQQH